MLHYIQKDVNQASRRVPFFKKLRKNASAAEDIGISYLDDDSLYLSSEADILLIVQVADAFLKNDHKPARFHSNLFYTHAKPLSW